MTFFAFFRVFSHFFAVKNIKAYRLAFLFYCYFISSLRDFMLSSVLTVI